MSGYQQVCSDYNSCEQLLLVILFMKYIYKNEEIGSNNQYLPVEVASKSPEILGLLFK